MRASADIDQAMREFGPAVWRACALYFRYQDGAEDAFQDTFLKYALADEQSFASAEHKRAWLIRVAINTCKDALGSPRSRNLELSDSLEAALPDTDPLIQPESEYAAAIDAMQSLPDPPKTPLYLALCEQWTAPEIAQEMNVPVNTVYSWISRGKQALREALS